MQEHSQHLVLLRQVAGEELSRGLGVFGQLPAVAEASRCFINNLPTLQQVDDVHIDVGQGLCTRKENKIVISNQSRDMTHLLALADGGKGFSEANFLAHGLPGHKGVDAAPNEALVFDRHAKVPVLLPFLGAAAPVSKVAQPRKLHADWCIRIVIELWELFPERDKTVDRHEE